MVEQWFGNSDKFFIYPLVYSLIICYMTHGLIVADKGFPSDAASGHFERNPDLHYLNPEKRNSRFIETHDLLSFSGILEGFDGVTYKKAKCIGANKWLYSFRDAASAAKEKLDWLSRAGKFYLIIFGAYGIICAAWSRWNQ